MPSKDSTSGDRFVIQGGYPLGGDVIPSGNKNEALPLLAAALLASGPVVIENVPRIRDVTTLIELVRALGVSVDWSEEHSVTIDASGLRESRPDSDLAAEIRASFLLAAPLLARTGLAVLPRPGGDKIGRRRLDTHLLALREREVAPDPLRMIRLVFARLGVETHIDGQSLQVPASQKRTIVSDVDGGIAKVDDAPWPGFPADLTPLALVLATQCEGTVLIHEKLFESRLFFVDSLIAMGARILLSDPHRALVIGPSRLHGATIVSPDIRAGMALIAAALAAHGRSVIRNVQQVDRGYERF